MVLGGLLVAGALILALTAMLSFDLRGRTLASAGRSQQTRAVLLADQTQHALDSVDLIEQVIVNRIEAAGVETPQALRALVQSPEMFQDWRDRVKSLPQLQAINLHDSNGDQLISTRGWPTKPGNVRQRPYFQMLSSDPKLQNYLSRPQVSTVDGAWVMYLERPIHSRSGAFLGTLGGAVDLSYFIRLHEAVIPSPASEISLFYDDGTLIIRTPKGRLDFGSRATDASLADALPKDQNRTALVQRLGLYDGVERLIAARRVPGYPLIVHAGINTEAALAGWREEVAYLSIATALLEAILVWVASLVWRQLRARSALARVLVNQDRVEKQRLDAALQLETVISAMPGLVIRLHRNAQDELRPSYISPSVKVLTGYSAEEVANPDWPPNHIEHGDFLRLRLAEAEALDKGQSSAEVTVFHRDGRPRRLSGKLRARRSESGEDELIVVWTDVTVEHEMTAQLAQASKMATLGELTTGMAHELNQPLSAISMAAENARRMLAKPGAEARVAAKLDTIVSLAHRGSEVIDHMRSFGRSGDMPSGPVSLAELIDGAKPLLKGKLNRGNVQLWVDIPADLPDVWAKPVPLEQVLLNIISNACDAYASRGEMSPPEQRIVRVTGWSEPGQVKIELRDMAGGIPRDVLPHIFKPFFTTKKVGEGTGLGLSISQTIMNDMFGTISAANDGDGAVFTITLPDGPPQTALQPVTV